MFSRLERKEDIIYVKILKMMRVYLFFRAMFLKLKNLYKSYVSCNIKQRWRYDDDD